WCSVGDGVGLLWWIYGGGGVRLWCGGVTVAVGVWWFGGVLVASAGGDAGGVAAAAAWQRLVVVFAWGSSGVGVVAVVVSWTATALVAGGLGAWRRVAYRI
nr:hypothetical protein [Tanacetum cinerariifolium]